MKEGEGPFLELAAQVPRLWRRGGGHGVRRGRPGRHRGAQGRDLRARLQAAGRATATEPQDIIFDPNIFAVATGIDEHRRYALDFIEAAREIRARCPGVAHLGRPVEPQLLVPRQRAGAPRDAQRVPLSRHPRRAGHGDRQRRPARRLRRDRPRASRSVRGRHPRPRATTRPSGWSTLAEKFRGTDAAAEKQRGRMARAAGRRAAGPRAGQGHRRPHRRGHRGSAPGRSRGRSRSSKAR